MRNYFAIALGFSGAAALAYQVAWQRVLTQIIGADSISMVLVVTIFMICLGVGAELARIILRKSHTQKRMLLIYAIIEFAVGLYGIFSIPLFRFVNNHLSNTFSNSLTFDFFVNLILLAPPIVGMGLTTPLIVEAAKQSLKNVGSMVGTLYGCNMFGAAAGAILTGLFLIETVGLVGTTHIAAAMNIVASLLAIVAFKKNDFPLEAIQNFKASTSKIPFKISLSAILFGFGTLAIQVIFFRILSNYFTLSTVVFPVVLCAYLILMALGQTVGGYLADKYSNNLLKIVLLLFISGSALFLIALRFPPSWASTVNSLRFTTFNGSLLSEKYRHLIEDPSPITVFLFSAIFMISVVSWSGIFPVMFRFVTNRIEDAGDRFAKIYTLYTIGNVAGTFICGFFLLPLLGTGTSSAVTVLIVGLGCFCLMLQTELNFLKSPTSIRHFSILSGGVLIALLMPTDYYKSFRLENYSVIDVVEGKTGVATVVPTQKFYTIIDINRTASASALNSEPGENDQYEAWRWNHSELMAIDPAFRPKHILIIGIGHAYLIDALLDLPFIEKITVVDISPEVISAVIKHTKTSTKRVFTDPRVEIVIADGRRYAQNALKEGKRFDLIQNKINEPWHAGGGNLFTEEFFTIEKDLLNPGGYLSTRPLNGHLTDGLKVFGNATWTGYYHLFFRNGDAPNVTRALITADIKDAWTKLVPGTLKFSERPKEIDVAFFSSVPDHLTTNSNTDDFPNFEYYWFRKITGRWQSPRQSFTSENVRDNIKKIPVILE